MLERVRLAKKPYILTLVATGLGRSTLPAVPPSYMMRVFNITLITYLCVLSVCVLLRLCGQNSFAQAGLWGIGACITANMVLKLGLGSATTFITVTTGITVFAFILGFVSFRLKQYYLTSAPVGLTAIPSEFFMNWVPMTGGTPGISDIPVFPIVGFAANTKSRGFFLILIVHTLVSLGTRILLHLPLGRSFVAIYDNEMAADCLGTNGLSVKSTAFAISDVLCGAAGAMYAFLLGYLNYQTFTYQQSIMYLTAIMPRGAMSPVGVIIDTLITSLPQEWVRPLQNHMQFIHDIGIMILMIVQPEGIIGKEKEFYARYIKGKTGRFTVR